MHIIMTSKQFWHNSLQVAFCVRTEPSIIHESCNISCVLRMTRLDFVSELGCSEIRSTRHGCGTRIKLVFFPHHTSSNVNCA